MANYCLKFPYSFLKRLINQPTRMSRCWQSYQVAGAVIRTYAIKVMYSMSWGQWYTICLFPFENMLSHIISRAYPVYRKCSSMWVRFRVVYKYITVFICFASSSPSRAIFSIHLFELARSASYRRRAIIRMVREQFATILASYIKFFCHFLMEFFGVLSSFLYSTRRAIFSSSFWPRNSNFGMASGTFFNHVFYCTTYGNIEQIYIWYRKEVMEWKSSR